MVLLGILALSIGMVATDHFLFKPQTKAAEEKLSNAVDERNKLSLIEAKGQPFTSPEDVQKILGRAPTRKEHVGEFLVEYYCWWGPLPLKRRYIAVGYGKRKDQWIHIKHNLDADIKEDDMPLSEEKAMEMSLKMLKESPNGPERQMPVPNLSAPNGQGPSVPATEPPAEPANEKATEAASEK